MISIFAFYTGPKKSSKAAVTAGALAAIISSSLMTGCGNSEKSSVSTTEQGPNGTVTTTTSTTTDVSPSAAAKANSGREVDANAPIDSNNQTVLMGTDTAPGAGTAQINIDENNPDNDRVHVNMPGVKVDGDEGHEKVDIDLPFVHVHKDGMGNTRIKAPFVRINKRDEE